MQRPSPIACCLSLACALMAAACGGAPQARTTSASKAPTTSPPTAPSTARWDDSDQDGLPDGAELHSFADRENFRRWFTGIAEMQFYRLSDEWNADQRDCAGLVRFSWREALKVHDRLWFQRMGAGYDGLAPDVRAYDLESSPLGETLFRTAYGSFKESDLKAGLFSEFADARTLKNFNTVFISRDRRRAEPGDLLFFYQPWVQKMPYHVMLFLGKPQIASEGAADWVVYHTGAKPEDGGTVKKVRLAVLDLHPDKRWRPVANNPNFVGYYRLKILD
ncbi:MAG TPA: DUF1175 family protein [Pyrinomonadaceae bacterium]